MHHLGGKTAGECTRRSISVPLHAQPPTMSVTRMPTISVNSNTNERCYTPQGRGDKTKYSICLLPPACNFCTCGVKHTPGGSSTCRPVAKLTNSNLTTKVHQHSVPENIQPQKCTQHLPREGKRFSNAVNREPRESHQVTTNSRF